MVESHHKLSKFFIIVSIFAIFTSILAIYSTTMASEYSIKKTDLQMEGLSHLTKSQDWWNDYQSHKLREKVYQMQIDNLNNTLHQRSPQLDKQDMQMYNQSLTKYQSQLNKLYATESVNDSLLNLQDKATGEQKLYQQFLFTSLQISKSIELYDFVTIVFVLAASLTGIAEIAKNKLLAYAGFSVGGIGIIVFIFIILNFYIKI